MPKSAMKVIKITATILMFFAIENVALATDTMPSSPLTIHYQSHLFDNAGANFEGDLTLEVRLYDSSDLGIEGDLDSAHLLYAEAFEKIHVQRGELKFSIGEGTAIGPFADTTLPLEKIAAAGDVYLELFINGEQIKPRQRFGFAARSIRAEYAKTADDFMSVPNITAQNLPEEIPASKIDGALSPDRLPASIPAAQISGAYNKDQIPDGILLSSLTSGTINSALLPGIPAANVTDVFNEKTIPSTVMRKNNFVIKSGTINDKEILSLPAGFSINQCSRFVALANTMDYAYDAEGKPIFNGIPCGMNKIDVSVSGDGIAHCELRNSHYGSYVDWVKLNPDQPAFGDYCQDWWYYYEDSDYASCTMNYIVVCKK